MRTRLHLAGAAAALALLGSGACATVPSPEIISVAADPGAAPLRCGALALEGIGYQTREVAPGVVEADQRVAGLPGHADRHLVELALRDGDTPHLVATVTRWRYEPSEHTLPIRRQAVHQARPDGAEVATIREAVEACGAEVRRSPEG